MARLKRMVHLLFPERQVMVRTEGRISYVKVSRFPQMMMLGLLAVTGGWTAYSSVSYVLHDRVVEVKEQEVGEAKRAYRSLLSEVAEYQRRFASITRDLEENHSVMLELVEQNATLQQNLRTVETRLKSSEVERDRTIATRERLKGELGKVEDQMQALVSRNFTLKDNLSSTESDLQKALVQRNQAVLDGKKARQRVNELEQLLANLQETQQETVGRLTDKTQESIEEMERLIAMTGLDVEQVLEMANPNASAQGGPFIEVRPTDPDKPAAVLQARLSTLDNYLDRLDTMKELLARIPMTVPATASYISSGFGKRRDPINNKWAMHYGIDFAGSRNAPIHVTAPGVVTFAGWKSRYGKVVEVDHGAGIKSIYGHLNKILVNAGDEVEHRQKVGSMGNTGRSTGVHVHYEIRFKGRPLDPSNFIKAGRHVFQG